MSLAIASRPQSSLYAPLIDPALSRYAENLRASLAGSTDANSAHSVTSRRTEIPDYLWTTIFEDQPEVQEQIEVETLLRAQCLLLSLPDYVPLPAVFVEDDGGIGLDWDEDRRRVISVSVDATPMIRYSGLIGADRFAGRLAFDGTLPATLFDLLRRLYPAPASHYR